MLTFMDALFSPTPAPKRTKPSTPHPTGTVKAIGTIARKLNQLQRQLDASFAPTTKPAESHTTIEPVLTQPELESKKKEDTNANKPE